MNVIPNEDEKLNAVTILEKITKNEQNWQILKRNAKIRKRLEAK